MEAALTKPAGCGRLGLAVPPVTTLVGMTVHPWGACLLTSGQRVGPMGKRELTESRGLWGATAQKRGGQTCMVANGWGGDSGATGSRSVLDIWLLRGEAVGLPGPAFHKEGLFFPPPPRKVPPQASGCPGHWDSEVPPACATLGPLLLIMAG